MDVISKFLEWSFAHPVAVIVAVVFLMIWIAVQNRVFR